jgi:hypothetical protein
MNILKNPRKEFDLQKEYNHLNKLLFNNQLPKNIPLKWSRSILWSGLATHQTATAKEIDREITLIPFSIKTKKIKTIVARLSSIKISDCLPYTRDGLLAVLAHEMIHVYFYEIEKDFEEQHGNRFQQKAQELSIILKTELGLKKDISTGARGVLGPEETEEAKRLARIGARYLWYLCAGIVLLLLLLL